MELNWSKVRTVVIDGAEEYRAEPASYFIVTYFRPAPQSNFVRSALQIPPR